MSAYEATVNNIFDSDAKFQAWVQATEAAFLASGFMEVAPDTGQINPATVVRPATNAYAGYRMYRAKDALAATRPIYVKLEFGIGSIAGRGKLQRTTNTGSNGSGTLTGPGGGMSATGINPSADGSGTLKVWGGGGEAGAWVMNYDIGSSSMTFLLFVCRMIDPSNGTPQSSIILDFMSTSSSVMMGAGLWTDGAVGWQSMSNGIASLLPDLSNAVHSGGNVSKIRLYEPLIYRNGETYTVPAIIGKPSELPFTDASSSQFALNIWGGSHNFLPLPGNGPSSSRLCIPWE